MATLTFVYSDSTAVVGPLATVSEPHSWDLCVIHAGRITAPRGWELVRHAGPLPSHTDDDDLVALADAVRERRDGGSPLGGIVAGFSDPVDRCARRRADGADRRPSTGAERSSARASARVAGPDRLTDPGDSNHAGVTVGTRIHEPIGWRQESPLAEEIQGHVSARCGCQPRHQGV